MPYLYAGGSQRQRLTRDPGRLIDGAGRGLYHAGTGILPPGITRYNGLSIDSDIINRLHAVNIYKLRENREFYQVIILE